MSDVIPVTLRTIQNVYEKHYVELIGIEPTTSSLRTKRSPKLSYSPKELYIVILRIHT
jgi:hypothetical protein